MATAELLGEILNVDPGDVRVIVESIVDLHDDEIPPEIITEVHHVLDPYGIRTVPQLYYPAELAEWLAEGAPGD